MADHALSGGAAEGAFVRAVLLATPEVQRVVFDLLDTKVFEREEFRVLLRTAAEIVTTVGKITPAMLVTGLEQSGTLAMLGGPDKFMALNEIKEELGDPRDFLAMVQANAMRRKLREQASDLSSAATVDWVEAQKQVKNISETAQCISNADAESMDLDVLGAWADKVDEFSEEVPTPFLRLNKIISHREDGGLPYGSINAISARTGVGKSTLLMTFLRYFLLKLALPVAYLNFEISEHIFARRLFAAVTGYNPLRKLNDVDPIAARDQFKATVASWKQDEMFHLRNQASSALDAVLTYMRSSVRKGVKVVVIDTVNRITVPTSKGRPRWEVMVGALQALEQFALEKNICLIVACQENREQDRRRDRSKKNFRPQLSDLADSSEIEKLAAVVLQLHRPDSVTLPGRKADHSELYITKNRVGGETGQFCRLQYDPHFQLYHQAKPLKGTEELHG